MQRILVLICQNNRNTYWFIMKIQYQQVNDSIQIQELQNQLQTDYSKVSFIFEVLFD